MRLLEITMRWMIALACCFIVSAIMLYVAAILTYYALHG